MSAKAKNLRKRLSLQNKNLGSNKLSEMAANMGLEKVEEEEEKEVTQEEDPLKYFSQQQRKKEKEEEAKKYLKPIIEEEDPLKFFDKNNEKLAEDEDPEKYLKKKEEKASDYLPKMMGKMISEEVNEKYLVERINNNDLPEELNIGKTKSDASKYSLEERKKKMEKRAKTSLRLSQRQGYKITAKDKLMERLQNFKNSNNPAKTNANENVKTNDNKKSGNTLLSADEQVKVNNNNPVKEKKDIDLANFMKKKDEKK